MSLAAENNGPLKGLRVVEMGQLIAGPFCGQLLGDMGAEVIKIEPPGKGDPMRDWGRGDYPLWWEVVARNKNSVSANLRVPEGQALAKRLIATADILIENFRPGTLEKWGLSPEVLHAANPGLIIVRVSGYGQTGPYATAPGSAASAKRWAAGATSSAIRTVRQAAMGVSIGDTLAATYGCMGALAALHHRDATGEGQVVDSALYEAVLQVMESLVPEYSVFGYVRERTGSVLPGIAPSNVYQCSDGDFLIGANQDTVFGRLCTAMGEPDLARDPRYVDHISRGRNQKELDVRIETWTRQHTVAQVEALMIEHGVPAGRVYTPADMLSDPHFAERGSIIDVAHPRWKNLKMQAPFPRLSRTPASVRSLAPQSVGQDNAEIYGELGIDAVEMTALEKTGAV